MRRRARIHVLLSFLFLILATGCGDDDPTGPSSDFDLDEVFTSDEAIVTRDGDIENLRMVGLTFVTSKATLREESKPILDKFAEVFAGYRSHTFSVEGHTASTGSASYNMRLSQDRAETVRQYLIDQVNGPAADITATGYGEGRPIDTNDNAQGRARNRRIEVIIRAK